jgi:hypothetical protein
MPYTPEQMQRMKEALGLPDEGPVDEPVQEEPIPSDLKFYIGQSGSMPDPSLAGINNGTKNSLWQKINYSILLPITLFFSPCGGCPPADSAKMNFSDPKYYNDPINKTIETYIDKDNDQDNDQDYFSFISNINKSLYSDKEPKEIFNNPE